MSDKGSRDELKGNEPDVETVPVVARLCYVDDSRTSAYVVRRLLQPFGYQVDYFQSAEPAFVALIQEDYDLLLTDLKVSSKGMDGDDLIRTLRQSGHPKISTLPVIVITGASDPRVLVDVYDAGANQVMNKPVDADELDGHIRRLLSDGKPELRVVEQQRDRDNVVSLSDAQRTTNKQSQSEDEKSTDDEILSSPQSSDTTTSQEAEQPTPEIPVLNTAPLDKEDAPIDDVKQSDQQVISEKPVAKNEKESLLERAVSKQDEQKSAIESQASPIQDSIEDVQEVKEGKQEDVTPDDSVIIEQLDESQSGAEQVGDIQDKDEEEVFIIEPRESANHHERTSNGLVEEKNILHEMDKHALVIRERTGLFGELSIVGAFKSLIELVGMRSLVQRTIIAGIAIVGILMAWNLFFDLGQPVETALVETGEIYQSITVPGRVLSKQRVNISSAHTGRTVKVLVKEGDKVKAGQVLAKLDDRELVSRHNRSKANLADAREGVVLAKRTLDRLRKAYKKGAVARRFVEDAEVDLRSARTQAGIAVEEAHTAKLELSKQQITAPFAGTITARFAEVGQWVGPTESLFTLVDESQREIEVRVDAADSVAIDIGQVVAVSSDAFPGLEWQESVTRMGTATDNDRNSNSVKVYISLGNDAPSLRFGQQVDADIRTAWNPNTLKVPFEALISRDGQTLVAVFSGGHVKLEPVETGIEDFSMVEIKQGLNEGELIILSKGQLLQNGDKVHPIRDSR